MNRYPKMESSVLEFKQTLPSKQQLIKTAIGFCNLHGGKLIIGITDDRRIVGICEEAIEDIMEQIETSIFDATQPNIIPRLYNQQLGGRQVLVIEITEGMSKPYYLRREGVAKGTYIRVGRHTVRATPDIIQELTWQSAGIDFECRPVVGATVDDLDDKAVANFLSDRKNGAQTAVTEEILRAYRIVTYDQSRQYPSVLGILLFGRNPQQFYSEAMIICSHFKGTSGREAIASVDCEGTLFNQFKQAYNFLQDRLYHSFSITGLKREEQLEIPTVAIREVLLNMIAHRNYHQKSPSKIAIYTDRVEFFSPGQFPGPLTTDNLTSGISYLRNPLLCKILREAQYIEKQGTGFIELFKAYQAAGLKKPVVIEGQNFIKCILPREKIATQAPQRPIEETSVQILALFKAHNTLALMEIAQHLNISKATANRYIKQLIKQAAIVKTGKGRSTAYQLKK